MSTAIRIENLGKKYTITRQRQSGSGYVSLRDVLSDGTKRMVQKILHPRGERGEEGASGTQEFWALKDIDLEVEQGDKLAIIGHNGAGKSTLLKVLSRITEPTTGRITLHGRIASLLEVGTGFHPELTGRENIFLNGSILGMSQREIKHKFDEIVDFSGVETFLDTPVKRYSSGMRMRLGFAVAANLDSEILVIDEVLAVGDAAFQKKCLGKMDDISHSQGRTILFVSHSMGAVQQLCNKGIVLNSGQLVFQGTQKTAIEHYLTIERNKTIRNIENMRPYKDLCRSVEFISIYFKDGISVFPFGSSVSFKAAVKSNSYSGNYRASLTIFTATGIPVGSSFSDEIFSIATNQEEIIDITIPPVRLSPGQYYISIALGRGSHETGHIDFDIVASALDFEVEAPPLEGGGAASWAAGWGNIVLEKLY